jgi:hypothetical protein
MCRSRPLTKGVLVPLQQEKSRTHKVRRRQWHSNPPKETMKTRLLLAVAGLAIGSALPTFAQQTNTPDPQLRQKVLDQDSPHIIGTDGKEMWATGGWSSTIQVQNSDPVQIKGFWAVIRGGDDLKIRMLSPYVTPADAKPSPTATPANQ